MISILHYNNNNKVFSSITTNKFNIKDHVSKHTSIEKIIFGACKSSHEFSIS